MSASAFNIALAERHVERGRRIVTAQATLVAEINARGGDTAFAEKLLDSFRRTQAVFEDDLQRLKRNLPKPTQ